MLFNVESGNVLANTHFLSRLISFLAGELKVHFQTGSFNNGKNLLESRAKKIQDSGDIFLFTLFACILKLFFLSLSPFPDKLLLEFVASCVVCGRQ